jgi:hypothetical protein
MRAHSGRTHPFEAVKNVAEELRWKLGESVTVHNFAVSSRSGRGSLEMPVVRGRNPTGLSTRRRCSGFFLLHEELRPCRDFDLATMQNPTDYPELGSPIHRQKRHYVNDFMLLPDETADSTCSKRIKTLLTMDARA